MHYDLIDAVDFAVQQNISDPEKIAIVGGSYGGYATLSVSDKIVDHFTLLRKSMLAIICSWLDLNTRQICMWCGHSGRGQSNYYYSLHTTILGTNEKCFGQKSRR